MTESTLEMSCGSHGTVILSMTEADVTAVEEVGFAEKLEAAKATFEKVADTIQTCCASFVDLGKRLAHNKGPKQMELEFGVVVKAGAAVIAHVSQESHFKVKFQWEFNEAEQQADSLPAHGD
jgi:hypothetical protein